MLLLMLLAACAGDAPQVEPRPEQPAVAAPAPGPSVRVRKEGGSQGRIDLFAIAGNDRGPRIAHCPEDCFEVTAVLPDADTRLEVVATGWPYLRMKGWKDLKPCARSDGGFMSPCRFALSDVPADGIVAVFIARPGFEHFGVQPE
jgi:hypothetical protein